MGNRADIQELINRITSSERMRSSAHFSDTVYRDEPILTTGRQMANYLPDAYREMRAISRWQEGSPHGRWLSEAELFYRQGVFMADYEDDCPYHGTFKAYFPTYSSMSDRQLRGYFTWRTAVRRGDVQETSLSYAYVYLYELLCGIGVHDARDGFERLRGFWQAYRAFAPEIDRYVRVWLRDYVVYHGLDPALLEDEPTVAFDRALLRLVRLSAPFDPEVRESIDVLVPGSVGHSGGAAYGSDTDAAETFTPAAQPARSGRRGASSALPLPPDTAREDALLQAIDGLSTYRIRLSRLYKDYPDDLRHVACAVYVRLLGYYRRHRTHGLIESLFGEQADMLYTMFASAIFFDPVQHAPSDYALDPIHRYRCREGQWRCIRVYGARDKSSQLGKIMRAVDRALRAALDFPHPLKEQQMPKYLSSMIDREVTAWLAWKAAHAPRRIDIDLSQLSSIRSAAAEVREALLTDEEREDESTATDESVGVVAPCSDSPREFAEGEPPAELRWSNDSDASASPRPSARDAIKIPEGDRAGALADLKGSGRGAGDEACDFVADGVGEADTPAGEGTFLLDAGQTGSPGGSSSSLLSDVERGFLEGLLEGTARVPAGTSEDMLVDAINEKLFDLVGDTVIEFGDAGPQVIEDYEDDVREVLAS